MSPRNSHQPAPVSHKLTLPALADFTPPPPQVHHGWPPSGAPKELVDFYRDKARAMNRAAAEKKEQQPPQQQQHQGPLELHVYRDERLFGKDDIITGPDKQQMLYYLRFPVKFFSGRWDLSLRRGGPDGPEVAHIDKGTFGDSFDISFVCVHALSFPLNERPD